MRENRARYQEKFADARQILDGVRIPPGGFYLWLPTPGNDADFARDLFHRENIKTLPGRYLGREVEGINPGAGHVRVALVPERPTCAEALRRIACHL